MMGNWKTCGTGYCWIRRVQRLEIYVSMFLGDFDCSGQRVVRLHIDHGVHIFLPNLIQDTIKGVLRNFRWKGNRNMSITPLFCLPWIPAGQDPWGRPGHSSLGRWGRHSPCLTNVNFLRKVHRRDVFLNFARFWSKIIIDPYALI